MFKVGLGVDRDDGVTVWCTAGQVHQDGLH